MSTSGDTSKFYLNCYLYGDAVKNCIRVAAIPSMPISELVPEILRVYNEQGYGQELETKNTRISVFRVDFPRDKLGNLETPSEDDLLDRMDEVADYWPNPGQLSRRHIQMLIKAEAIPTHPVTGAEQQKQLSVLTGENLLDGLIERFKKARLQYCDSLDKHSASEAAKPGNFNKQQKTNDYMLNGRPRQHTGPPIVIYHPVFGSFLSNLLSSDRLSPEFYNLIFDYLWASQDTYDIETGSSRGNQGRAWERNSKSGLEELLGKLWQPKEPGVIPDGEAIVSSGGYCILMEMKNEIGAGGSDPSIQAAQTYSWVWRNSKLLDQCSCPSILLAIAGPWMCVLGAVFLNRPVVQPLTDFVWVGTNPSKPRDVCYVARIFHSIVSARKELEAYYSDLAGRTSPIPRPLWVLPYPTHFTNEQGQQVDFTYISYLDLVSLEAASHLERCNSRFPPDKLIFVAKLCPPNPPTLIVVKFVESYNADAHKLLARQDLAPKLLYDGTSNGNNQLGPDYRMIVMEHINGINLGHYLGSDLPEIVSKNITDALELLHAEDLVFGDLRKPNIMLVQDATKKVIGAKLIDFD
ncbi:unnamed protein product [Rhizoctonia solani]|uniref:Protein kinase domain-containing protein n=1 Tax=Rhizoctonia solani TaxID=456999 RepID=A0A8H2XID7_9AGAM|nr:unnamed protein product [Rhizoctonia solani]